MTRYFFAIIFLLAGGIVWASEDYVKVRYIPGYSHPMSGYLMEVVIEAAFGDSDAVISDVYKKLKEIEKSGRLQYCWPDVPSISIEVSHKGEVVKSSISPPGFSDSSNEFANFSRLWNEAYALAWESIEGKLKPVKVTVATDKTSVPTDQASCEAQGGTWGRPSLMEKKQCNRPTADAGKKCSDHSECESDCVTEDSVPAGTEATGKCFGWTVTLGKCMNLVKDGKAQGVICVD